MTDQPTAGVALKPGDLHTLMMKLIREDIQRQRPDAFTEDNDFDLVIPTGCTPQTAYTKINVSDLAEAILPNVRTARVEEAKAAENPWMEFMGCCNQHREDGHSPDCHALAALSPVPSGGLENPDDPYAPENARDWPVPSGGGEPVAWRWRFDDAAPWLYGDEEPGKFRFSDPVAVQPLFATPVPAVEAGEEAIIAAFAAGAAFGSRDAYWVDGATDKASLEYARSIAPSAPGEPLPDEGLRAVAQRMADDWQSSASHHPEHVLVRKGDFEALVTALEGSR